MDTGRRGFTIVEAFVACVLLTLGLATTLTAFVGTTQVVTDAKEREVASVAVQSKADELWAVPYANLFASYSAGAPLEYFDVPGLATPTGRPKVGRVVFLREAQRNPAHVAGAAPPPAIADAGVDTFFGAGFDLDGDGTISGAQGPVADAPIEPVVFEVQFVSASDRSTTTLLFPTVFTPKVTD